MAYRSFFVKFEMNGTKKSMLFEATEGSKFIDFREVNDKFRKNFVSLAFFVTFLGNAKK